MFIIFIIFFYQFFKFNIFVKKYQDKEAQKYTKK